MADEPQPRASGEAPRARRPFQFGLKHLLAAPVVLALLLGLAHYMGFARVFGLACLCFIGFFVVVAIMSWRFTLSKVFIGIAVTGVLIALFLPAVDGPRGNSRRAACYNNLHRIALAMLAYESHYGCFPPAYVADKTGRRMHSWRALILPYLDYEDVRKQYRLDEPWDGPNNSKLAGEVIREFRCRSETSGQPTETSYLLVVGPETAWRGARCVRLGEIDNPAKTILVVEVRQSGIHWMEPRDLDMAQMPLAINAKTGQGISSGHGSGVIVAFADGHQEWLPDTLTPAQLRRLLTIHVGEPAAP